jgi:hypothetical protein
VFGLGWLVCARVPAEGGYCNSVTLKNLRLAMLSEELGWLSEVLERRFRAGMSSGNHGLIKCKPLPSNSLQVHKGH